MERTPYRHFLDRRPSELPTILSNRTSSLREPDDLNPLMDRIGDARVVMLGEATHGTSEFYTWRAKLSRRLIEEKDFSFVAVEGDWPPCYRLNRFLKGYEGVPAEAIDAVGQFERWPTWMWANWEMVAFIDWMRRFNANIDEPEDKVGFFGLDVYSLQESLSAVLEYLEHRDTELLDAAHKAFRCFEPHGLRGADYARATTVVDADCRDEVAELLSMVRNSAPTYDSEFEAELSMRQNARVVANAEHYYRTMLGGGSHSWNIRDKHMGRTLDDLLEFHGPDSRAVVWEHNTHIGDARYTDMAANGMLNLGQIGRQRYGHDAVLVGFGTHRGHVIAGRRWGAPMEEMVLPPAQPGSWEETFHNIAADNRLLVMDDVLDCSACFEPMGHRAVGVVYQSGTNSRGNYVPTILPRRYDAFIHIDHSQALHPLHIEPQPVLEPEMFPWGI